MSWTDPSTGVTFTDLIWVPVGFNNDASRRANKTDILAYPTIEKASQVIKYAFGLSDTPPTAPVTAISYTPTPAEFAKMAAVNYPGGSLYEQIAAAAYALAESSEQNRVEVDGKTLPFFHA